MITAENVVFEVCFNFFISWKNCVPFFRYSIFHNLNLFHQLTWSCDALMSKSTRDRIHFWINVGCFAWFGTIYTI